MKASDIKGKKLSQLIEEGFLPKSKKDVPFSGKERDNYEFVIRNSDAYKYFYNYFTQAKLKGSEKQIAWAEKIRAKKADKEAFYLTARTVSIITDNDDFQNEKYKVAAYKKEFCKITASYWIDNRF